MRIRPLPPLNSLVAFEAAARYLSFTAAASELSVTQGAISRQVRQLEDYLGRSLFVRENRTIALTPAGLQYYQTVSRALADVSEATSELIHWQGDRQVTVATTNAMASLWLLPKIPAFQRNYDDVEIRILASDQLYDLSRSDFDLGLMYCPTPPPSLNATPLFREEVFPVCSPAYLQRSGPLGGPEDLLGRTLLYLEDARAEWFSWKEWFHRVGVDSAGPRGHLNINNYPMLIQAAINGQGIALAWGHLLDHHLESGALVRPVDTHLRTEACFYLLEPEHRVRVKPAVRAFRDWLLTTLRDEREAVGRGMTDPDPLSGITEE
ncbi:transcriptional regulator GcvA [Arhodomonas aquaeolei]|uniref:transcriptional regulator GcvA n=1 Tax=Arhodomonas aquaeolei TaxID=2369 RepID=UPI002168BC62|nr:transcriptional regulator GcvA [Arhodomonas aquaeolei]MCS4505989.1 transcriptional regulator GcvA [Arhodomonas aquaeolei]